jgi:hypothetical protein
VDALPVSASNRYSVRPLPSTRICPSDVEVLTITVAGDTVVVLVDWACTGVLATLLVLLLVELPEPHPLRATITPVTTSEKKKARFIKVVPPRRTGCFDLLP